MKKIIVLLFLFLVISAGGYLTVKYYSYVFAKTVDGQIEGIERVTDPTAVVGINGNTVPQQLYSFAVAIRDTKSKEIITASSEDRQWAVVRKGQCAQARFFPYPPWVFDKAGTYFGARLVRLYDCPQ